MAYIDQNVIEEIKVRNDIEQVISGYVHLKRAGSNMQGLCPFHSEKTPSFTVFTSDQSFYCFGCGAGGDVISFIRRAENLDYPSAVEFLARRVGITVTRSREDKIEADRRARTLEMNRIAAKFYHETLMSPDGKAGLDYLLGRGLTMAQIKHFGLGFAPNGFSALTGLLRSKGYTDSEMSAAFLCGISSKTGKPYDYFRNRVMFPIISTSGEIIAFGGRVMDDSNPKYLNSSDTPAFKKSRNLFALNFAKSACSEQMILCEGYMDVIALHGAGFTNAVATLGTAITPEQARIMKHYTSNVVICYDADAAGQNAASKAFRLLGEAGADCRIVRVENAKDPDEYIKKFGAGAFKNLLQNKSRSEFDFKLDDITANNDMSTSEGRIKAIEQVIGVIADFPSETQREVYAHRVAETFGVSFDTVISEVKKTRKMRENKRKRDDFRQIVTSTAGYGDRINPDAAKNPKAAKAEEAMIGILLLYPEYIDELRRKGKLPEADDFFTEFGKKVYKLMLELSADGVFSPEMLGEGLTVEEMSRLEKLRIERRSVSNNTVEVFQDCYDTLKSAVSERTDDIDEILKRKRNKQSH